MTRQCTEILKLYLSQKNIFLDFSDKSSNIFFNVCLYMDGKYKEPVTFVSIKALQVQSEKVMFYKQRLTKQYILMKIEIKFTYPSNKQLQYDVGKIKIDQTF